MEIVCFFTYFFLKRDKRAIVIRVKNPTPTPETKALPISKPAFLKSTKAKIEKKIKNRNITVKI